MLDSLYGDLPPLESSSRFASSSSSTSSTRSLPQDEGSRKLSKCIGGSSVCYTSSDGVLAAAASPSLSSCSLYGGVDYRGGGSGGGGSGCGGGVGGTAISNTAWAANRAKLMAPPIIRKRDAPMTSKMPEGSKRLAAAAAMSGGNLHNSNGNSNSSIAISDHSSSSYSNDSCNDSGSGGGGGGGGECGGGGGGKTGSGSGSSSSHSSGGSGVNFSSSMYTEGGGGGSSSVTAAVGSSHCLKGETNLMKKMSEEYHPLRPNEYEQIVRERLRRKQQEELDKRRQLELEQLKAEREAAAAEAAAMMSSLSSSSSSLNISGEEAWKRRGQLLSSSTGGGGGVAAVLGGGGMPVLESGGGEGGGEAKKDFATRMMEKMGWKHGEGLGRQKQGIIAPLVAKKTDKRSGVIVQGATAAPPSSVGIAAATAAAGGGGGAGAGSGGGGGRLSATSTTPVQFNRTPTRIVLLTNMVGAGEVDEDLQAETEEEAAKFGNLLRVKIVEAKGVVDEEAVRIFCEYELISQATRALMEMNGRSFGGRVVKAKFYDEERFEKDDWLPGKDEG